MNTDETFSYWEKPYEKWLLLLQIILVFINVYFSIKHLIYINNPGVRYEMFSQSQWEECIMQRYFGLAINSLIIIMLIGLFIIGCVVKREKTARKSEGILFVILGILWGFIRVPIKIYDTFEVRIWIIILITVLGIGFYSLYKSRKLLI